MLFQPVAATDGTVRITDVSVGDANVVIERGGVVYTWQSDRTRLITQITTGNSEGQGHYELCVKTRHLRTDSERDLSCRSTVLAGNSTEQIVFEFEQWPPELIGRQTVSVVVTADTLNREVAAKHTFQIHVIRRDGDLDRDGLTNRRELKTATNFSKADTDGDGIGDGFELNTYGTDPKHPDSDGDGITDGLEVHIHKTDPNAADTDTDGLHDPVEITVYGTNPKRVDTDGDGLDDAIEVNTFGTVPDTADTDGDGLDDGLEVRTHETNPNAADTDGDGLRDPLEVYTYETDPNRADTDGDGLADGKEVHVHETDPTRADTDGDGLKDGLEITTYATDPNTIDTDGDGLADGAEVRRYDTDPTRADTDGDGRGDGSEVSPPLVGRLRNNWLLGIGIGFVLGGGGLWLWFHRSDRTRHALLRLLTHEKLPSRLRRDTDTIGGPERESASSETEAPPLTNEDRVRLLLEERGGRIRQSAIVDETDWSKSTVSRVLSRMEEEGQISKINVGRGNIITLPGREPERAKPPFDDGL